jgi:predicted Fe-Mo cluster-binding NifX family protein
MNSDPTTLICLACYKDRLASVCENAEEYKLFEIRDEKIYPAGLLSLPSKDPMDRTSAILACGVPFLLCGAICAHTQILLETGGINVIPWLTGSTEEILKAFITNSFESFRMPGCRAHENKQHRVGKGQNRCRKKQVAS